MRFTKVNSIFDYNPCHFFGPEKDDPVHSYIVGGNYYEYYYAAAKMIQPKTICEIGVRFGYSLCCMALAIEPRPIVTGVDNESYTAGSMQRAEENLKSVGVSAREMYRCKSVDAYRHLGFYDLIHIDGDHSLVGAYIDICAMAWRTHHMLVDDYDDTNVGAAVDRWVGENREKIDFFEYYRSDRGLVHIGVK